VVEVTSQAIPAISCIDLDEEEKPEKKSDEAHVPSWELTYPTLGKGTSSLMGYVIFEDGIMRALFLLLIVFTVKLGMELKKWVNL